jgi:hypothetical protein
MCGSIPTEIKTNVMQRPLRNKRNAPFTLSYSEVVRDESTMEFDRTMDEDSTMNTVTSNQTPHLGGQSVAASRLISSLSTVYQCLLQIDRERDNFNSKQRSKVLALSLHPHQSWPRMSSV